VLPLLYRMYSLSSTRSHHSLYTIAIHTRSNNRLHETPRGEILIARAPDPTTQSGTKTSAMLSTALQCTVGSDGVSRTGVDDVDQKMLWRPPRQRKAI
jgi:hypothetical protein